MHPDDHDSTTTIDTDQIQTFTRNNGSSPNRCHWGHSAGAGSYQDLFEWGQRAGAFAFMAFTSTAPDPAEVYLSQLGTDHSRATARSALRTIAHALGVESIVWSALTYADFARVRAELGRLSVPWGNTCLSVLRRCVVEGRRVGVLDPALVDDVLALPRLRGTSGRLGRDIDSDEIEALFDACDPDTVVGRRDRALLALLVFGALRRSECAAVDVADVDLVNRVITVRAGKGRKTRQVPLPRAAVTILGEWMDMHPDDGQLLRSVDRWGNIGDRLASDSVAYVLERVCDTAGIEPVSPHAFRAHRISEVLSHADPLLAQRFAGHSSVSTTAIYDRRGDEALADIVDHIADPQSSRESDQSSVHASTVWTPSAMRNTATCPNEAPIVLAS